MKISVCIATYRRADRLRRLLDDLSAQQLLPHQVVIVDNDSSASARSMVEEHQRHAPYRVAYDVQPERNIAKTRNRTVALADCEWLAFVDDDERAPAEWLSLLAACAVEFNADGVLAPVEPQVPKDAPAWIQRGRFYDFPHQSHGALVPLNRMRFGNVLLRASILQRLEGPFDERYELMTGEDGDLLVRLVHQGARIVWSERGIVLEPIEEKRLTLRWLMLRAYSGGQEFARQTINGRYGPIGSVGKLLFFSRICLQSLVAGGLALLLWPTGKHRGAQWLVRAWANLGKMSAILGRRYRAYS